MNFEIVAKDVMGRIGKFKTPHGTVETQTILPVVNPNIELIPPKDLEKFGAQMVITNAYIFTEREGMKQLKKVFTSCWVLICR